MFLIFRFTSIVGAGVVEQIQSGDLNLSGEEGSGMILKIYQSCVPKVTTEAVFVQPRRDHALSDAAIEAAVAVGSFYSDDFNEITDPWLYDLNSAETSFATRVEVRQNVSYEGADSFLNESTGELVSLRFSSSSQILPSSLSTSSSGMCKKITLNLYF